MLLLSEVCDVAVPAPCDALDDASDGGGGGGPSGPPCPSDRLLTKLFRSEAKSVVETELDVLDVAVVVLPDDVVLALDDVEPVDCRPTR